MYFLIIILFLSKFDLLYGDVMTNFGDKRELKLSMLSFENQINPEKLQHWMHEGKVSASPMSFEPPFLDFSETPIGQPKWDHVKILNEDDTMSIHLYSISSSTIDFHCSLFKEEILPGGGNSSFDIVFLSRQLGHIKNTLYIHTNRGTFYYKVSGIGSNSPYRIKPFFKAKIPLNSSFVSPIYFYNPYAYPIQILEMYTSGGDAHLELPNQSKQAPKKLWIVPPYETRTIMRVKFLGRKVGNFTSFIRIRTNTTDNPLGFVIPLQIEISNMSLLYCVHDNIYFGILRSLDSPKSMKLLVVNSANESIRIKSIALQKPNEAVNIEFQQINVLPGIHRQAAIATITFSAFKAISPEQSSGHIVISTFQNQTLTVPYVADVIHGSLVYDANNTKFFTDSNKSIDETRHIAITNTFDFSIAIYSISLPPKANCCFKIANLSFPIYIKSKETESSIKVQFSFKNIESFITQIAIFSNISLFVIPLFVYNGKLTVVPHRPEMYKGHLDFGTLGIKTEESLYFTLKNENPTEVTISSMSTNWIFSSVYLIGVEKGNNTTLQRNSTQKLTLNFLPFILKPYHFAVFRLMVFAPDTKGVFASDISIVTQYENLSIPYYLRTTDGVITTSSSLVIKHCFPSKVSKILMTLNSSFQSYIELTSVKFIPNDTRFSFDTRSGRNLPILIKPLEMTTVGYIKFSFGDNCLDPLSDEFVGVEKTIIYKENKDVSSTMVQFKILSEIHGKISCYVGFSTCTKLGYQWLMTTDMNSKTYDIDKFIYKRIHQQWETFQATDNHQFNVTLQMDTSSIKGFLSNIQVQLVWPSILSPASKVIKFPLTQIGNFSFKDIYLENPSDNPILLQLILISHYFDPYSLIELLGISDKDIDISNNNVFTLHPKILEDEKYVYTETMREHNKIKSMLSIDPHNESTVLLLLPKSRLKTRIYFNPNHESVGKKLSTILVLRNNLTSIETVWLEGQGTYGELLFQSGHLHEETSILHFELTEKHLKSCDFQPKGIIPSFTVRRPFVIKNVGKIPVYIIGFQFGPLLNLNANENQGSYEFQGNDSSTGSLPTILENVKSDVENKGENMWCAGYGFEILECYGYQLEINETLKLEIVFTPDFSLHKVIQQLQIHTSLNEWPFNITAQASLPAHMLHRCSQALARPDSEVLIWYMAIVVLSVVTMAAILMSYYEADRIFTSNVIYRHLSSVAIGSYPHSTGDRICDFRAFSKNSPFMSTSNQIHISPRSSVHDYLSIYNNTDCDSTVIKRINICKKHDDKIPIGISDKIFSQSLCGKNIPEDITSNEQSCSPLTSSIHQHKKKKKRGLIFGLIQWVMRSFTQIVNQNTALKPRLEDHFNYKTDSQQFMKNSLFSNSKSDDTKTDHSNKSTTNFIKNKVLCYNQDVGNPNNISINPISNNNSNQQNHSKKNKNRSNCTNFNSQSRPNINKQESTIATLNFAPIDIPALDSNKYKRNLYNNKKQKKSNPVITEELKNKNSLRMDDSLSVSTDSSTDEKVKETETIKISQLTSNYKSNKSKKGLSKSCNICFEGCSEDVNKQIVCIEHDEDCSIKSNDSGIESTRHRNNYKLLKSGGSDNSSHRNVNNNSSSKHQDQTIHQKYRENIDRKEKLDSKIMRSFKSHNSKQSYLANENSAVPRGISKINSINTETPKVESNDDIEPTEFIEWENESVINTIQEDFSILSERTEKFSNFIGLYNSNSEDVSEGKLKSDIENWLSSASSLSFSNVAQTAPVHQLIEENKIAHCGDYSHVYSSEEMMYHIDSGCHVRGDCTNTKLCACHSSCEHHLVPGYYKPCVAATMCGERFTPRPNCNSQLFPKSKYFHDIDTIHNASHFISLELPGIAIGRKQKLLEYERRGQKDHCEHEWLSNSSTMPQTCSENYLSLSKTLGQYWDDAGTGNSSAMGDKLWNMSPHDLTGSRVATNGLGEDPIWLAEKCWNQVEPGSQHDTLARTLLPIGLLSGDSSTGIFSTNPTDRLWNFKADDANIGASLSDPCKSPEQQGDK